MRKAIVGLLAVAALLPMGVSNSSGQAETRAQQEAKPAPPEQKQVRYETVTIEHCDSFTGKWGKGVIFLKGHVKFRHGDTLLTSDEVQYDQEMQVAVSPGPVHITDPECDISGKSGSAYFKKKLGVIEGNVVMNVRPKPEDTQSSGKESLRAKMTNPTTVTCPKIEYQYKNKVATGTGGVFFKQDKRSYSSDKVVYEVSKELLAFNGNVKGTDENDQKLSAPKATVCIKKGAEWIDVVNGNMSFKVNVEEENTQESAKQTTTKQESGAAKPQPEKTASPGR